jgi:hypothetical protein
MPVLSKRNRGRPRKTSLVHLPTMIWYQAVQRALGFSSAYKVEVFLEPTKVRRNNDGISRNNRWDLYRDGKRDPDDVAGGAIEIAEAAAPGTARWIRTPLWKAVNGEFEFSDDLQNLLGQLPAIRGIVFSSSEQLEYDIPEENGHPALTGTAPVRRFEVDRIGECICLEGLDLLEVIVLLLEFGHLSRNSAVTSRALELYRAASPKICEIPELRYSFELFFEAVEGRYVSFIDVPPDEIFPPWHVRMPNLTQRIYDIDALRAAALTTTVAENSALVGTNSRK